MSIVRKLEPEVMDTEKDSIEYDEMDFTEVNTAFASRALDLLPGGGTILDLGTGTARIPLLMMQMRTAPTIQIDAVDLSAEMLKVAGKNIADAGLGGNINLVLADVKSLGYEDQSYDMVISNSLIHHIPAPLEAFAEIQRLLKGNGALLIRDLIRPQSMDALDRLVDKHTSGATKYQKGLFRDSLHAALTIPEVEAILREVGAEGVVVHAVSDRHWSVERAVRGTAE